MVELYNRIHQTHADFAAMADRIAALAPDARAEVMTAFDGHWRTFELTFAEVDSFRLAERSRRTRFLLDLMAAEERGRRAGREHAVSGAVLLTLFLRGVKYCSRREVEMMWRHVERLRNPAGHSGQNEPSSSQAAAPILH